MLEQLPRIFRSGPTRNLILVLVGLSVISAAYGFKKNYDPGPVTAAQPRGEPLAGYASHADFEKDCKHCHAPVRCLSANLCQDCHLEIARQRTEHDGLHARLPGTDKCQTCHREHQGREAVISAVPLANINHAALAGFSLVRHELDYDGSPLDCHDCHRQGRFGVEMVDCTGCHNEVDPHYMGEHTNRFGGECLTCHDGQDRMIGFDHNEIFALEGAHEAAECDGCHVNHTFADMSGDCTACHEEPDVHAGQFGVDCARCHMATAWTPAELTQHTFFLDHGSGDMLDCEWCHVETYAVYTCYECHDHDPVGMREVHVAEGILEFEACAECHPTGQPGEAVGGE